MVTPQGTRLALPRREHQERRVRDNHDAILPADWHVGAKLTATLRLAAARLIAPSPHARKATVMSQPWLPSAYSLIGRQEGSSSGWMTCTAASSTSSVLEAAKERRAAASPNERVGVIATVAVDTQLSF
jgi:hypothetical protein